MDALKKDVLMTTVVHQGVIFWFHPHRQIYTSPLVLACCVGRYMGNSERVFVEFFG